MYPHIEKEKKLLSCEIERMGEWGGEYRCYLSKHHQVLNQTTPTISN